MMNNSVNSFWNTWIKRWRSEQPRRRPARFSGHSETAVIERLERRLLPATFTVNSLVDSTLPGSGLTLREACDIVNAQNLNVDHWLSAAERRQITGILGTNDTVVFASSLTSSGSAAIHLSQVGDVSEGNSALIVTRPLVIQGTASGNGVTLFGPGQNGDLRMFLVEGGGNLTLKDLTLANGASDESGGSLYVQYGGTVSLDHVTITKSYATADGGAIFNYGQLTMTATTLTGCQGRDGGGLMNFGNATVTGCTFSSNHASGNGGGYDGGGHGSGGTIAFTNCLLSGNTAQVRGGGLFLGLASEATLTSCMVTGNSAHDGGACCSLGGGVTMDQSIISMNSAVNGGGFYIATGGEGSPQVGSGGGTTEQTGVRAMLSNCTVSGNSADRGGGLYSLDHISLSNCTVTGNHANQGGGIFNSGDILFFNKIADRTTVELSGTVFSANTAELSGGGLFNNGAAKVDSCNFTNNSAGQGGALYNDLGSTGLTGCVMTGNVSTQGAQLFNHLGVLTLAQSIVADSAQLSFITSTGSSNIQFVAPSGGEEPSATIPPTTGIVNGPDGIRYALTANQDLLRQLPLCGWTVLDYGVKSYKIAPNGNCYWLNVRGELYCAQAGYVGCLIGTGVQSFAMDANGTVYNLSHMIGFDNFALYRSLTAPLLDPVGDGGSPCFCQNPPTGEEVLQAAGLAGPAIQHVKVVTEPIVDELEPPRYFPGVGLAQMHVCRYKSTIYWTASNGEEHGVIYIDKNELETYALGEISSTATATPGPAISSAASQTSATDSISSITQSDIIVSMSTGPDGTIYTLGGDFIGTYFYGQLTDPLVLWRLPAGGNWEPLDRVYSYAVAPDGTLYALNANSVLERLAPGSSKWLTLTASVLSFSMAPNSTVYALSSDHSLRCMSPGATQWSTLDSGVRSFTMAPDGTLYELNNRLQLKRLTGNTIWSTLDIGVQSFSMDANGRVNELNGRHQLKQLTGNSNWMILDTNSVSFQMGTDGTIYSLDSQHQLKQLTSRNHWTLVDAGVVSFVVAPNAFHDVYLINSHHQLKRLEAGYSWSTLRTDAVAVTIDSSGIVTVRDTHNRLWKYWAPDIAPILDPVEGGTAPAFCMDTPSRADVLQLLNIPDGSNVKVVIVDPTEDTIDPPRFFKNSTNPLMMHHCQYQCTVQYTTSKGVQTSVVYIDRDSLLRAVPPTP